MKTLLASVAAVACGLILFAVSDELDKRNEERRIALTVERLKKMASLAIFKVSQLPHYDTLKNTTKVYCIMKEVQSDIDLECENTSYTFRAKVKNAIQQYVIDSIV